MSSLVNWLPDYKQRYGDFTNPLPEENTVADYFQFVPQDQRPGIAFNFPVVVQNEHGITADNTGTAFTLNAARDSVLKNAQIDGATLALVGNIPYDVTFRGRNGAGNGNSGGAFRSAFELKTSLMMQSIEFYRELSLLYGPGAAATIAADIGVLTTPFVGATYGTGSGAFVSVTKATWAPGIWNNLIGALVDVYNSAGTATVETGLTVVAVNPDYSSTLDPQVQLFKSGSAVAPAAGTRIVPAGWATKSCIGLESVLKNTGIMFGIDASIYPMWRPVQFAAGGQLSRSKVLAMAAKLSPNGLSEGGKLFVSHNTFADLAEEADALQRFTGNTDETKRQGANNLEYKSPSGVINVALHKYLKLGEAFFVPNGIGKRVGSTDITFRGEGQDWFFLELPNNAGCQLRAMSNQAIILRMPYRCAIINGIQNGSV